MPAHAPFLREDVLEDLQTELEVMHPVETIRLLRDVFVHVCADITAREGGLTVHTVRAALRNSTYINELLERCDTTAATVWPARTHHYGDVFDEQSDMFSEGRGPHHNGIWE